ncbi:SCO6745 family protein [Actinospongicola halichondriae]|uniref:SCO6745 family protein n=1 Tax=Actinospongicola halichondriae TaxID=3236844 RepID=UPI003D585895
MPLDPARALAAALEPFTGQVYFSPECHQGYEALGFGPSSAEVAGVQMPEISAYFTSRGSVMGQVPGEVVAAAFGVFKPAVVVPAVAAGWAKTDATTIEAARTDGAVGQLRRILGDTPDGLDRAVDLLERATADLEPAGKPLYAGLRSQALPDAPLGAAWRLGDMLREYRGDAHVAVWTAEGLDACEIGMLTELYWGLPARSYSRTRGWDDGDYAGATARLEARGLLAGDALSDEGSQAREAIEVATDRACAPIVAALGDDLDELVEILGRWSSAIRGANGYPAAGPVELAEAARR